TAMFAASASGTAPLSYQWRRNGTAITAATSSTYRTPPTLTSDSGAQFSVSVSNSVGSVTSGAATLTVNAPTYLLSVSPASLSFGNVNMNATATLNVTLTNSGNSNVTISSVSTSTAELSATGVSPGTVIGPGKTV